MVKLIIIRRVPDEPFIGGTYYIPWSKCKLCLHFLATFEYYFNAYRRSILSSVFLLLALPHHNFPSHAGKSGGTV